MPEHDEDEKQHRADAVVRQQPQSHLAQAEQRTAAHAVQRDERKQHDRPCESGAVDCGHGSLQERQGEDKNRDHDQPEQSHQLIARSSNPRICPHWPASWYLAISRVISCGNPHCTGNAKSVTTVDAKA